VEDVHDRHDPIDPDALEALVTRADELHASISRLQRDLLALLARIDAFDGWESFGARDAAHWLWMRYGISDWKARRWIACSHALESLPRIAHALSSGVLGIDKVVELTRFATRETERDLIAWADGVSPGAIRRRAEIEQAREPPDERSDATRRSLESWIHGEGRRMGIAADLPAADGAAVLACLESRARTIPVAPGEENDHSARLADALVMACTEVGGEAGDGLPRPTVLIHVPAAVLASGEGAGEIEGRGVVPAQAVRRLGCTARVGIMIHDAGGDPLRLGRTRREPSRGLLTALRHRDRECVFPGCGSRRFTHAHHERWWSRAGPTDIENLVLICSFHHRLVHEGGWRLHRPAGGPVAWYRPDGTRYVPGPAPPEGTAHVPGPAPPGGTRSLVRNQGEMASAGAPP